ncbi:hypothetical protein ACOSP7_022819 [Xanthoceras sorbifolium]
MFKDSQSYAKQCDRCQRMANVPHLHVEELTPMASPWPFAQWKIDIIAPFLTGSSQKKFAIIGVDYFTKWVEVEAVAKITVKKTSDFVKKFIIFRFGVPKTIVTDYGTQFDNANFRALCGKYNISLRFASPAHPHTNDQNHASLAFGTKVVLPTEAFIKTKRVHSYSPTDNDSELRTSLEELNERRKNARLKAAALQQRTSKYYNSKAKPKRFEVSDLILKKVIPSTRDPTAVVMDHRWLVSEETVLRDI